jgi:kynureninase
MTSSQTFDRENPLAVFHQQFWKPAGKIYLDGHSLGLMPKKAETAVQRALQQWRDFGVEAWVPGQWFDLPEKLASKLSPLLKANRDEVIIAGSTTVNLHQLLASFYRPTIRRRKILIDQFAFPSDRYAVASQLRSHGLEKELIVVQSRDGRLLQADDLLAAFSDQVAVAILPSIVFTTSQRLPLPELSAVAEKHGVHLIMDCSHSVGCIPHNFSAEGVRLAFWCGYKYLNGGPGASAGLFCAHTLAEAVPALAGWWGHERTSMFSLNSDFQSARGAARFQISTPGILSLAPLEPSLDIFSRAGIEMIRTGSLRLTEYLIQLADERLPELRLVTPRAAEDRGGHIAFAHPKSHAISVALRGARIVADFRAPDLLRLTPVALYTSFDEVERAVEGIRTVLDSDTPESSYPYGPVT